MSRDLYVRDGSRFVPLPEVLLRDVPPIPVPQRVEEGLLPAVEDPANPQRTILVVERCPHGSFPRYAAGTCCRRR